jgi:HEPN domain-containing protein
MTVEEQTAKQTIIASFLRVAAEDLEGARMLLGNRNAPYLLSQAAEKIIKAILTSEGIHGGRDHQLDLLVDKIPDEHPLKPLLRDIQQLSSFSTTFRYPTPTGKIKPSPPREELEN